MLKKRYSIQVTQEVINNAVPCDPRHCVIAMAFEEKTGVMPIVRNGKVIARDPDDNKIYKWVLPASAALVPIAIDTRDKHLKDMVVPFTFQLNDPIVRTKPAKPVLVREHGRALPGEADNLGYQAAAKQRSMGAKLRKALADRRYSPGSRFQGV